MTVVAFAPPKPSLAAEPVGVSEYAACGAAESRLRLYGLAMRFCFMLVLGTWAILQIGCLLSLFLHFQSGIVAGTINGTLAFKFWPPIDYFSPSHASASAFVPHAFPTAVAIGYSLILFVASVPFCAALFYLAELFGRYSHGEVFTQRNATVMRRMAHSILATGYSPLLLGPLAHAIGVLRPITGITDAMIAFMLLGLILLAISHVMEIGKRLQQDQEAFL